MERGSMSKSKLLSELQARGLSLSVEGSTLLVSPKIAITPDLEALISEHKGELFAAVWQAEDRTCPACGAPAMRRFSAMIIHGYVRFQCGRCSRVCWRPTAEVASIV
jgi:hypothetical protein